VADALKRLLPPWERRRICIATIQEMVAARYSVPLESMTGADRHAEICAPRHVAMYLGYRFTSSTLPELGKRFGGRHHTTILGGIRKIDRLRSKDADLDEMLNLLEAQIWPTITNRLSAAVGVDVV